MKLKGIVAISLLSVVIFTSCGTSEGLFSKRKYRKGVYYDLAESKGKTKVNEVEKSNTEKEIKNEVEFKEPSTELYASSDNSISLLKENKTLIEPILTEKTQSTKKEVFEKRKSKLKSFISPKKGEPTEKTKKKNWAAIVGFILAFLCPIIGVWFCIIGLKSELYKLARVGYMISIIYLALVAALILISIVGI